MTKKLILFLFIFATLIISGCNKRALPQSAGRRDAVILIAPENIQTDSLKKVLEQAKYYPSREEVYRVKEFPPSSFDQYKYWRNVIVVGTIGKDYVDNLLTEEAKESLSDYGGLFSEEDLWVKLQSIVVIVGKDAKKTQKLLNQYAETVYQIFRNKEREHFQKVLYMDGYQKKEMEKMEELLGASFKIPYAYKISRCKGNFMAYIRKDPDRLVTLLYRREPIKDPISFRDSLFAKYFKGDSVYLNSFPFIDEKGDTSYLHLTTIDTVRFKNEWAIWVRGVWQNQKYVMGGPFVCYVFEKDGVWYFLDGHVFAPGKKKWPYLDEVDIILQTFKKGF
ncbi:MAG: DUF4837 family protein [candidate division WOR-3 bacterium]|nr:DUF4837 family protein [candidate division WOR-3 bacterium]